MYPISRKTDEFGGSVESTFLKSTLIAVAKDHFMVGASRLLTLSLVKTVMRKGKESKTKREMHRSRFPDRWNKATGREQLRQAARNAVNNARDLLRDAEILVKHKRWPRSIFLTQIASEEIGKHVMLVSALVKLANGTPLSASPGKVAYPLGDGNRLHDDD